jgi:hypothetical protein
MVKPEDKAFKCKKRHKETGYCKHLKHIITNGQSSKYHCKECKEYQEEKE